MNIIILDDSPTIRMTISAYLDDLGVLPCEIHAFENGHLALDYIKDNGVDLIFSDIHMPLMNGYEFAEEVFKILPNFQSSFFAISGDESSVMYKKMKKTGVHRFIKKPIDSDYFNHFIAQEIEKHRDFVSKGRK